MKKGILIPVAILLIIVGGIVVFYMKKENTEDTNQVSGQVEETTTSGFALKVDGKTIKLGETFESLNLEKEEKYYEVQSCAFNGLDKVYTYANYEVNTFPENEIDKILSIYLLNDKIETTEGLKIGDSKEKMIDIYGENYETLEMMYTYKKGKTKIDIIVESDKITSIEYVFDTEN